MGNFRHHDPLASRHEVDEEIAFYLEMRAAELRAQGMSAEEARAAAAASFGDIGSITEACGKEQVRRTRRAFWQDVRVDASFALRMLRHSPAFTLGALLTLAVGIGAATAVFSLVNGVLLRPLPYDRSDRLAMVWMTAPVQERTEEQLPLSAANYLDVVAQNRSFDQVAAFRARTVNLRGPDGPQPVAGVETTPELFSILRVSPILGRTFTSRESVRGGPLGIVLSSSIWHRLYGGDSSIVGRDVDLGGRHATILGVLPDGFSFPRGKELPGGFGLPDHTEVWMPMVFTEDALRARGTLNLAAVGRLRPGVSRQRADADLGAIAQRLARQYPDTNDTLGIHAIVLQEQAAAPFRRSLFVLLAAVGLLLLIACANVANLLLARTTARTRELAMRAALGAGAGRIARQLVTENVLLALAGGALALGLAVGGRRTLLMFVPSSLPRVDDIAFDASVFVLAGAVTLAIGIAFGWAAARHALRSGSAAALRGTSRTTTAARAGRRALATAEVVLSLLLLVGAGLLGLSYARLQAVAPGFDRSHALTASVFLPIGESFNPQRDGAGWARFFDRLLAEIPNDPGVQSAGAISSLPLSGNFESSNFEVEGVVTQKGGPEPNADYSVVGGDFFHAIGTPVLVGRALLVSDRADTSPVMVVNRQFVRRYFPHADPVGKRIRGGWEATPIWRRIVGVVGDTHQHSLAEAVSPMVYFPEDQRPYPSLTLVVRTTGDPGAEAAQLKALLRRLNPTLTLTNVRTLDDVSEASLGTQRFRLTLLGVFAASALVLVLIGLYGVIALTAGERRREIGIRLALGAQRRQVLTLIAGDGLRLTLVGLVIGWALALPLSRLLQGLLFDVSPTNLLVLGAASAVVAGVTLLATLLPALRAARVAPTVTLSAE
jgi:putative ABC transport system permease protein